MTEAFICDAIRTPVGRYNGGLAPMRVDDLAAHPIKALMQRNTNVDWGSVDDVIYGCVNQAGEDNRNVARMAGLLAGRAGTLVRFERLYGGYAQYAVLKRHPDDRFRP